jgi:transposase
MGTTSVEIRRAIVRLREEEELSYEEIAEVLGIGRATVNRVLRRHRHTGRIEPLPRGGGNKSPIHDRIASLLVAIVTRLPDATVAELADALSERASIATSRSAVQRALTRLGYSKKRLRSWRPSATRRSTDAAAASSVRSSPR